MRFCVFGDWRYRMVWQELFGFAGGALVTVATVPQVWRLFKTRSARDISLPFTWLFMLGTACWLTYGILMKLPPVILWNALILTANCAMFYAKLKYG